MLIPYDQLFLLQPVVRQESNCFVMTLLLIFDGLCFIMGIVSQCITAAKFAALSCFSTCLL